MLNRIDRARAPNRAPRLALLAWATALLCSPGAYALSFDEAYSAARGFDAQYRGANFELESARQVVPIARASLLPSVGLNATRTNVAGTRSFPNGASQEVTVRTDYSAPQTSLQMRMPLLNMEAMARYSQSKVQVETAEYIYRARGLELIDRLGNAYLQVLLAEDTVLLAQTQVISAEGQLARADQRFKRGEGTRTDAAIAQAAVDVGRAHVLEARDQAVSARRALKRLTGLDGPQLNQLATDYTPDEMIPSRLGEWLSLALANSPTINARRQAAMAARLGVDRQSAGHYPRVDLVASIAHAENETLSTLSQSSTLRSVGIQLTVPLYSGGGVQAGVTQALADLSRAEEDIKNEREGVEVEVQRQFQAVATGAGKIAAYRNAVASSEVAYQGAVRSLEAGLGTTAEVLDAQTRLFTARHDLAQTRYDYLLARLRLMTVAGLSLPEIVADIDRQLAVRPTAKP